MRRFTSLVLDRFLHVLSYVSDCCGRMEVGLTLVSLLQSFRNLLLNIWLLWVNTGTPWLRSSQTTLNNIVRRPSFTVYFELIYSGIINWFGNIFHQSGFHPRALWLLSQIWIHRRLLVLNVRVLFWCWALYRNACRQLILFIQPHFTQFFLMTYICLSRLLVLLWFVLYLMQWSNFY